MRSAVGILLFAEFWVLRPGMSTAIAGRIASIDLWYGIFAAAIVVIGFCRAIFAAKGWAYHSHNTFFWAKVGCFAAVGLLPIFAAAMARGYGEL
jgi:putative membrane protein